MGLFAKVLISVLLFPGLVLAGIADVPMTLSSNHTEFFSEDWEDGMGLWSASNGVWEVGIPTSGTTECFGSKCVATNLSGHYPYQTNSRLESETIALPESPANGVLWLGIWHWFNNSWSNGTDYGSIQIWTEADGWTEMSNHFIHSAQNWAPHYLEITEYAGQTIKLGFFFKDIRAAGHISPYQNSGWYIDQIRIFDGAFPEPAQINRFDETADMDWDGWYPDQGVWELGEPVSGISEAHSSNRCFGTNLGGDYPYGVYSRLISPSFTLSASPLAGKQFFSIKQYCSLSGSNGTDQGFVQINNGSGWTTLYTLNWINNVGSKWVERVFDISEYAGQQIRLGFVIDDNRDAGHISAYQSHGWYLDDLQFSQGGMYSGNPEHFENFTPNWQSSRNTWEVGIPTSGPEAAFSGTNCWATNLDGNYPYGVNDRLSTAPITLANTSGISLRFQHWYSFSNSNGTDYGEVSIRPEGEDWTVISTPNFTGSSGSWTQWVFDLSGYAGQTVQFGFRVDDERAAGHISPHQSSGWYIDDFEIFGMTEGEPPSDPYYFGVDISAGPAELTFPHATENIEKVIIYGSPVAGFIPSLGTRLAILPPTATSWIDTDRPGWPATYYRVSIVDNLGNESVPISAHHISAAPGQTQTPDLGILTVKGAAPNPFNPTTHIKFTLPQADLVDVKVYDLSGRKIADLLHKNLEAGPHKVVFAPRGLASGTYFARVSAGGQSQTKKMVLLK